MKELNPPKNIFFKITNISIPEKTTLSSHHIKEKKSNLVKKDFLGKKREVFHIIKEKTEEKINEGRWNTKEQKKFIEALDKYSINWKKIGSLIPTRTISQIRAHAQKFFNKLKKYKDENLGIDLTLDSIHNIKDAIDHIKSVNSENNIFEILSNIMEISEKENLERLKRINIKRRIKINNFYLDNININNINNVYKNYTIHNCENDKIKEKNVNKQINDENNNNNKNSNNNNIQEGIINKNNNSLNNNNYINIMNNNYLKNTIVNNIINIMNYINNDGLKYYLSNINNYYFNDIKNNLPFNDILN